HRTTVPPSFEPGAAPDDRELSPYASFARPLSVAASQSLSALLRPTARYLQFWPGKQLLGRCRGYLATGS
ncbi:hypothetical protein C8F01DRAFT_1376692, partial [Mycena amicta]